MKSSTVQWGRAEYWSLMETHTQGCGELLISACVIAEWCVAGERCVASRCLHSSEKHVCIYIQGADQFLESDPVIVQGRPPAQSSLKMQQVSGIIQRRLHLAWIRLNETLINPQHGLQSWIHTNRGILTSEVSARSPGSSFTPQVVSAFHDTLCDRKAESSFCANSATVWWTGKDGKQNRREFKIKKRRRIFYSQTEKHRLLSPKQRRACKCFSCLYEQGTEICQTNRKQNEEAVNLQPTFMQINEIRYTTYFKSFLAELSFRIIFI